MDREEEMEFVKLHLQDLNDITQENARMRKYVAINYPAYTCNMSCPYCYIGTRSVETHVDFNHDPQFIRWCLSRKRLGGSALIVICGNGETLLGKNIVDVCDELLKEGHFIQVVTNGTVTDMMDALNRRADERIGQLLYKCSFHYLELKRLNFLDKYANNIRKASDLGASFTVELVADDTYIDYIDEIKEFSIEKFGALPHVTIARDDSKQDLPIITQLSMDMFYKTWKQFESSLFEIKWMYYGKRINECDAGLTSLYVNLLTGNVMKCLSQPSEMNLYDTKIRRLELERVKNTCTLPYCYNNHAYLTLGVSEHVDTFSYLQVRDRISIAGEHWVKEPYYSFIGQKLYENK